MSLNRTTIDEAIAYHRELATELQAERKVETHRIAAQLLETSAKLETWAALTESLEHAAHAWAIAHNVGTRAQHKK